MLTSPKMIMPTLPTVAIRLLELYDDPDVELSQVVELLQTDPAITAKIIKAANSSAYGVGREVSALRQAVSLLGKAIVTPLVLSFSHAEKSMSSQAAADLFRQYWLQAIVQAITAECLAKHYAKSQVGEWFVAGLLSSIGRLAFINHDAEAYAAVMEHAEIHRVPLHEAEQELLRTTTADLSAELLREWNLPSRWVDAAANQIRIVDQLETLPAERPQAVWTRPPCLIEERHSPHHSLDSANDVPWEELPHLQLSIGMAAASAVGSYFCRNCQGEALIRIVHLMEEGFGADEDDVDTLLKEVRERVDAVSHLFQVSASALDSPMELTSLAMQHLARLAVEQAVQQQHREMSNESAEERRCLLKRIDRLMRRASTDALTGTYNRGYFDDRFAEQTAAMITASRQIGLVFIDVDHFKSLNDTYGHMAGDEVLRQIAAVLKGAVRSTDVVARYGGEEFVVIVSDPRPHDMGLLGERLRAQIEQMQIVHVGKTLRVTVSVGAAMGRPISLIDGFGERLIAAADRAMYEAKRNGRNRVVVADPLMNAESPHAAPIAS